MVMAQVVMACCRSGEVYCKAISRDGFGDVCYPVEADGSCPSGTEHCGRSTAGIRPTVSGGKTTFVSAGADVPPPLDLLRMSEQQSAHAVTLLFLSRTGYCLYAITNMLLILSRTGYCHN